MAPTTTNGTTTASSSFAKNAHLLNCGIVSGLAQAAVFNPWDRALYLSVMHHRDFLHSANFKNPMAGVLQTITQRAFSSGLYFPLEDIFAGLLIKHTDNNETPGTQRAIRFTAGLLAGSTNGLLLNPFSSVKVKDTSTIYVYHVCIHCIMCSTTGWFIGWCLSVSILFIRFTYLFC